METLSRDDDLAVLLARLPAPVTDMTRVSPLVSPHWPRAAYRVAFADGTVRKARRFESAAAAARFRRLVDHLPTGPFPRVVDHEGRAVLLEWIDGAPPALGRESRAVCHRAGAILGQVHGVPVDRLVRNPEARNCPDASWADTFTAKVERLCHAGALDAAQRASLVEIAVSHAPPPEPPHLVLGDLAPDNIVVDPDGALRVVDTDGVGLWVPAYDLARARYRWPMTGAEWRAFEDGYAWPEGLASYHASILHWTIVVLVGAAAFRVRHGLPDAQRAIAQLHHVAERRSLS